MMNTENEYMIEELLVRYYEGKASEEEAAHIGRWLKAGEENRHTGRNINRLCLAADTLELEQSLDTRRAFQKTQRKIALNRMRTAGRWLSRAAAVLFIPMAVAWLIQYNTNKSAETPTLVEVQTHAGMSSSFTLPDGTSVRLNSGSSLIYPSEFNGSTRNVSLKGEAYFEVRHDAERKFIVSAPHNTRVEVLGTQFNLEAYEQENRVMATLLEGKINFLFHKDNHTKTIRLTPGNKVIYNAQTNEAAMFRTSGASETGWTQGKIILENTPLEEALHLVGKHFQTDFVITTPALKKYSFTGVFANQSLERVLDKFRLSSQIRWRYSDRENNQENKPLIEIY